MNPDCNVDGGIKYLDIYPQANLLQGRVYSWSSNVHMGKPTKICSITLVTSPGNHLQEEILTGWRQSSGARAYNNKF